jgi:DNA-binding SARP family transcriptional activator
LLDQYGTKDDIGLLRAFAKIYTRRGPKKALGKELARRVSPPVRVHDLGRVSIEVGERFVELSNMRRKPASVLVYLITRPGLAANREQVIDELWRDADPAGAVNNLNQSLYFLRREIDPWYEDDVSVDYINFQADLVWLDRALVSADSVAFLDAAQRRSDLELTELARLITAYRAAFAPEFEYDEWALGWRARVHAAFLDLAHDAIARSVRSHDYRTARDIASHVLGVDESATDVERQLVWVYGKLGLLSSARSQYAHLLAYERADGIETPPLDTLLHGPEPS